MQPPLLPRDKDIYATARLRAAADPTSLNVPSSRPSGQPSISIHLLRILAQVHLCLNRLMQCHQLSQQQPMHHVHTPLYHQRCLDNLMMNQVHRHLWTHQT